MSWSKTELGFGKPPRPPRFPTSIPLECSVKEKRCLNVLKQKKQTNKQTNKKTKNKQTNKNRSKLMLD